MINQSNIKFLFVGLFFASTLLACSRPQQQKVESEQAYSPDVLHGCYSIEKDMPAQIWIHDKNGKLGMQMKEYKGSHRVWDDFEEMRSLSPQKGWHYFQTNGLQLDQKNIEIIAVRPDETFAIAKVNEVASNTNPFLDSVYVVSLFGAVNTIYSVACDNLLLDKHFEHHK